VKVETRKRLIVLSLAICTAASGWMFLGKVPDRVIGNSNVVGGLAGLAALALSVLAIWPKKALSGNGSSPASEEQLLAAQEYLARETLAYWREQAKTRRITTPTPASVSWRWAGPDVAPPPSELVGDESALALLSDRVVSLLRRDLYEALPVPGRIVILGGPGAGKTTAMILLLIEVLAARADARTGSGEVPVAPVPAWLTLGGWDPEVAGLLDYAASVVNRDYPGLAAYAGSVTALELLRSGRIALFLDGLDEMRDGVRGPALEAIDRASAVSGVRVVMTSRPDEFRSASFLHRLWDAAVIEVQPIDLEHACEFLLFQQKGAQRAAWQKVTNRMRSNPDGVVAQALRNPLALSLARDTYTHTDAHPAALFDHPTPDDLLKNLLIRLLIIAYPDPDERAPVVRWLSWIAVNMNDQRDIRWWDIPAWLAEDDSRLGWKLPIVSRFVEKHAAESGRKRDPVTLYMRWPTRLRLRRSAIVGLSSGLFMGLITGLLARLGGGPLFRLFDRLMGWHLGDPPGWFTTGVMPGLLAGLIAVFTAVWLDLVSYWSVPFPLMKAASPLEVYRRDFRRTIVFALAAGIFFGLLASVWGLVYALDEGLKSGLVGSVFLGILGGILGSILGVLGFGFGTAAELLLMERLGVLRDSPARFMSLLQVAHDRQVLRQVGAVYQFRHAALQDLLASSTATHGVIQAGADE
jgi:hypothetical protein